MEVEFYRIVLDELKEDLENENFIGTRYLDMSDYEDGYSHNDIRDNIENFVFESNKYFEQNKLPYLMIDSFDYAIICDKKTGKRLEK